MPRKHLVASLVVIGTVVAGATSLALGRGDIGSRLLGALAAMSFAAALAFFAAQCLADVIAQADGAKVSRASILWRWPARMGLTLLLMVLFFAAPSTTSEYGAANPSGVDASAVPDTVGFTMAVCVGLTLLGFILRYAAS